MHIQIHVMMILGNKEECYEETRNFGEFLSNRKRWNQIGNQNERSQFAQSRALQMTMWSWFQPKMDKFQEQKKILGQYLGVTLH